MKSKYLWYVVLFLLISELTDGQRLRSLITNPLPTLITLAVILVALVVHEFAHAYTADRLGDPNPRLAGRVSLNPAVHLDPIGTILIVLTGFGWGKPVEFDPYNLNNPVKDGAVIAAAGPLSNIILAVIAAIFLRTLPLRLDIIGYFIYYSFIYNINLAVFNLLPVYPLDGHHILRAFLPRRARARYDLFNHLAGLWLAFALILPLFGGRSLVSWITAPASDFAYRLLLGL